jgi:arylsulfatase A-like enzyme
MDLLPTFAALAGAPLPQKPIDGHDIRALLLGEPGARSPWDADGLAYYHMEQLQAIRSGDWKLYLPLDAKYITLNRKTAPAPLALYDVRHDVHEDREASAQNPEVVRRLTALAEKVRAQVEAGQRPAGWVEDPKPLLP